MRNGVRERRRVLVRGADTVGSFTLATPFYRELRRALPDARITLCIKPLVETLARLCPHVDEVLVYRGGSLVTRLGFIRELRRRCFDTAFLVSGSAESALQAFLAGIPERVGYPHDHRGPLLSVPVREEGPRHYVDYILRLMEVVGLPPRRREPEVYVPDVPTRFDRLLPGEPRSRIAFNPTVAGTDAARTWPVGHAAQFVRAAVARGMSVVVFGTSKDAVYGEQIVREVSSPAVLNLAGRTDLPEFVTLLRRCALFVGASTGGIHLAAALGLPCVGLYCPDVTGWAPYTDRAVVLCKDVPCAPCNQHKMKRCRDNVCMRTITVGEVLDAVERLA